MYTWQFGSETFDKLTCPTTGNLSYIFTGFGENQDVGWLHEMVASEFFTYLDNFLIIFLIIHKSKSLPDLQTYRSGCIVVVDYWKYTKVDLLEYSKTVEHYDGIVSAVVDEVVKFKDFGFQPTNTFIFGYSFGGQVAL